jgi:hypothetical protein
MNINIPKHSKKSASMGIDMSCDKNRSMDAVSSQSFIQDFSQCTAGRADMADISVVSEEVSDRLTMESSETRDFFEHF